MKKKTCLFNLLMITALFLGACNLPSGNNEDAVGTAAAQTLAALLSATPAISATPSFTPLPATLTPIPLPILTNTPVAIATSNCNGMQFITDVTYPDGTTVTPGQNFTKIWRIKNVGTYLDSILCNCIFKRQLHEWASHTSTDRQCQPRTKHRYFS